MVVCDQTIPLPEVELGFWALMETQITGISDKPDEVASRRLITLELGTGRACAWTAFARLGKFLNQTFA